MASGGGRRDEVARAPPRAKMSPVRIASRGLGRVLLALWVGAGAAGCYTMPDGGRRPGVQGGDRALSPNVTPAAPAPVEQAFDARLVDPRLERAIADYWRDLRTLRWDSTDMELRRSLRLLAIAAEHVPYTGSVDLVSAAAGMRGGRSHRARLTPGAPAGYGDGSEAGAFDRSLTQLAAKLIELAQGPYRDGVGVLAPAYAFEQAVRKVVAARVTGGDRRAAFEALGRGEELLFAIRGAIGRGEVGLVSAGPPPVDFGP